ncbi:hypothetical protein ACFC4G_39860 [Streptomyces sp. NPDC056002]|uniref:Tc toxin subunit A-related protein n=1 Tax=Streptomyces sp. NPDC056002 TaxID=3345675 RepID=UPI0035D6BF21
MAQNYASERYWTKSVSKLASSKARERRDRGDVLTDAPPETAPTREQKIQDLILAGNEAYTAGKYQTALDRYLAAWAMFPQLIYPPLYAFEVDDAELLDLDIRDRLAAMSEAIHRYRPVVGNAPIRLPDEPPPDLVFLTERGSGTTGLAEDRAAAAAFFAAVGESEIALGLVDQAIGLADGEITRARISALAGVAAMRNGQTDQAHEIFRDARNALEQLGDLPAAASMEHNLVVLAALTGEEGGDALARFVTAADRLPESPAWNVTQSLDSGFEVTRPVGADALPLIIFDADAGWCTVPSQQLTKPADAIRVLVGDSLTLVHFDMEGNDLVEQVLKPRITETELARLVTPIDRFTVFVTYLCHVREFILPLALGDTYFALGDYERAATYYVKARDYPYLNETIERPMLWARLARTYLTWAEQLYRQREPAEARVRYEQIVAILGDGSYSLTGPLYEGGFAPLRQATLSFLQASDRLNFNAIDYSRRILVLEALNHLTQILQGINYLGLPEDIVPIHDWRYLQNSARYFANQAIQAERAYVNFKSTAEKEELTRVQLEQAVDAQRAAMTVDQEKLKATQAQFDVARANQKLSGERIRLSQDQWEDYVRISAKQAYLERIAAKMQAAEGYTQSVTKADVEFLVDMPIALKPGWTVEYGIKGLMEQIANRRSELTITAELNNMNRKLTELRAAEKVVEAEAAAAEKMVDAARSQVELAELRVQQAHAQLDFFDSREFTPELWENLAQAQRALSRRYLDSALRAAFLMERAFDYEYDTQSNRVRFDYARSELHGLLAGDFLLADVDQFSYDRLVETEKRAPAKIVVSLADRYPLQFYLGFRNTGSIDFETLLEEFDQWCPGSFQRKLRRVEVVVEGLIGTQGVCGTLTNSGVSYDRGRNGRRRTRLQKPETMVLSRYDIRNDGVVFTVDEEQVLSVFENSGVASGWILDFPPSSNDVDYRTITNIHVVLYFDTYYSKVVRDTVRADVAAHAWYEHSLGVGLADQFPDEFLAFRETGEIDFEVPVGLFPRHHTDPVLRDLYLLIDTHPEPAVAGLVTRVEAVDAAVAAEQPTDSNGMISTGDSDEPINKLRGVPLVGRWKLKVKEAEDHNPLEADFSWGMVQNVYLAAEYTYTPRGRPAFDLDLSSDPLAGFEVVDDPKATVGGPSRWSFDSDNQSIDQGSRIRGPGAVASSPVTPGTYLVRKAADGWPLLSDFVLQCTLESGDYGGVGLVFRYQDPDNFYFFTMTQELEYRRIGKKVAGNFAELDEAAFDPSGGYDSYCWLAVSAVGDAFVAYLDGEQILAGRDSSLTKPGRVGLYTWNNSDASFEELSLRSA